MLHGWLLSARLEYIGDSMKHFLHDQKGGVSQQT